MFPGYYEGPKSAWDKNGLCQPSSLDKKVDDSWLPDLPFSTAQEARAWLAANTPERERRLKLALKAKLKEPAWLHKAHTIRERDNNVCELCE